MVLMSATPSENAPANRMPIAVSSLTAPRRVKKLSPTATARAATSAP